MQTFTEEELASEEWRDVVGYEGLYLVSDLGRVRNPRRGLLKQSKRGEYRVVHLTRDGRERQHYVHTAVLAAFVGARVHGMVARHFPDRDGSNNRLTNLAWGTVTQNAADRVAHGTDNAGSRNGNAVLCEAAVVLMRWLNQEHEQSPNTIGPWFNVSVFTAGNAIYGRSWQHVSYGLRHRAIARAAESA